MFETVLQTGPSSLTLLGSAASIVGLVVAIIGRDWIKRQLKRFSGREKAELRREAKEEFVAELFGEATEVERVEDGAEYGRRIDAAAADAVKIRRLSGNLEGQEAMDDYEEFCDPEVEKDLLVIRPEPETGDPMGMYTGNELIRHLKTSRDADARAGKIEGSYRRLETYCKEGGDWENVDIRSYWHVPWIRMAIYEDVHGNREAGFTFSPTVVDFRDAPLFWTTDSDAIAALNSYYDDIWTDERTVPYTTVLEEREITKKA